ncbi:RNAse (barnase) inhibitor barstar [Allocatelliglobosispora scoriae]|uniref:RNAse (Barnase) inhibitor barstar n=1 Tax=Allocatelliglobosispora scoriae TaxID=643052 RepID=A0A841C4X3_9ACTN|nr:barstar family protein [Allocatelliglobosispora scoriae]MBB5874122.1 RNAse (barnase) inhibitor barstar [Allocatelliglobosispora scoriae]
MAYPAGWLRISTAGVPAEGFVVLDARRCRTRTGLFAEFAAALRLPGYFGHNWDALADCLSDLGADGPPLAVLHAEELLADEAPRQLATLLDILATTVPGVSVVLHTAAGVELRRRVGDALGL